MKVLHVIAGLAPRYGGPVTSTVAMCRELNRTPGTTVEVAATDADGPGGHLDPAAVPTGFDVHLFRRTVSDQWSYSPGLSRWLKGNVRRFDVVHVHGLWNHATWRACRNAERADVPYVLRPAGMLSEYCLNVRALKKRIYTALIERRTMRRAAAFHATGGDEAKDIARVVPGAKTFVIPHGMEEAAWTVPANPGRLRELCGPAAGENPIVLFLGRLHPVKGITDLLLPAFAGVTVPAHLALVGGTDSRAAGYDRDVEQTISRFGLSGRVSLLGEVARDDRWNLFDGAAAFVLPSYSENFGMVVAEAMARGCPVVVTETVNAAEHVTAAGCGLVVPRDVGRLTAALTTVLTDPTARTRLGSAGARYAADQLAWPRVADALIHMYQSLVPAPRGDNHAATPRTVAS